MNLKISLVAFLLLVALSAIAYAFGVAGTEGSIVSSIPRLAALSIGIALVAGFAYPYLRGVRKGDAINIGNSIAPAGPMGVVISLFTNGNAVALENGRKGNRIKVQIGGRMAEGIVIDYESTFSPASVKLTEIEQVSAVQFHQ